MWTSLRTLGSLTIALVLGSGVAYGGDLSNVTVGRFEDFTVVTLFGEGPLSVTHQIVEAKDGKPHRIVVDVTGAVHRLPQNNYAELPEGSITAIRTSQFAVSPEPVVRVVLDLAHPAAYRLESPEGQVRLLISLPADPAMATTWSAREGTLPATGQTEPAVWAEAAPAEQAQEPEFASADPAATADPATALAASAEQAAFTETSAAPATAEPSATESTSETSVDVESGAATEQSSSPSEAEPAAPASTEPAAQPATNGEVKALPLAPAGALAVDEATSNSDPSDATAQNAWEESASSESAMATAEPAATEASQAATEHTTQTPEPETAAIAARPDESSAPVAAAPQPADAVADPFEDSQEPWKSDDQAPEVPLPEASKAQPERVIDYNLPLPAALAATAAADAETPAAEADVEAALESPAPKMAVKSSPEGDAASSASTDLPAATGNDAAATDVGSAPVASLSTLPPMVESAEALMPERKQVIYHTHGKRDPFKALLTAGGYSAAALPDVTTLRLVGVLQDVMESWGLFEDANGYGYILRKGDRVKNGSLTQLTNNRAYFNLTEFGWSRSVHIDLEPEG